MGIKETVINDVTNELFRNDIRINDDSDFYLSHIIDDLFCIYTKKNIGNIFCEDCSLKLNPFFEQIGNMLLTDNLNGKGCFDYENSVKNRFKCVKDKMNNYLFYKLNFILIRYSMKEIKPLSFFTYNNSYIWTVCTNFTERKKGYMTILFKHFINLVQRGELNVDNSIQKTDNNIQLNLLKKNPDFDKTKKFYEECGFIKKEDLFDKIVMITSI